MSVRLVIQEVTYTVISAYAPHAGLGEAEKRRFWESLDEVVRRCPLDHRLLIGGDLNGHVGMDVEGYAGVHGGFGYGDRNEEGLSILEFAVAHDLVVVNSFSRKTDAQLATFHSGGHSTQIDYLLLRKGDLRTCGDCKVLTALTCSSQHRLLVIDLVLQRRATKMARQVQPKILWKKLNGEKAETFRTSVVDRVDTELETISNDDADQMWNCLASTIRVVAKEVQGVAVGTSRGHRAIRESWWFSDEVQSKVARKQRRFRELITFGEGTPTDRIRAEERYKEAKREAKKAVAQAKERAYEDLYKKLDSKEGANDIYRIAKARERRRRDLDNIKFIKNDAGQTLVKEEEIRKIWEEYFSSLFVGGRPERHEDLQDSDIEQSQNNMDYERIRQEEVRLTLRKMGRNKSVGPDQIPIEAWRCLGDAGVRWLTCLFNKTFRSSKMPMEWRLSETIPIYKNKGDAQRCVIETRLQRETNVSENQFGFMPKRSSIEAIHIIRNLMEKHREKQRNLEMVFLDLEKAYDCVPRNLIWKTLKDRSISSRYINVIRDMYEGAKSCVRTPMGNTEVFPIEVGLHQGSALSPFLFALILDGLSRGIQECILWCLIFADDIVLVSDSKEELNRRLEQWRVALESNGLHISRQKTEYLSCDFDRNDDELVRSIIDKLREERLRWFGHVRRRPLTAPVRRVEALTVDGVRRRGRPNRRWEDRLKLDLKELLLTEDMTSDRIAWRTRIRIEDVFFCALFITGPSSFYWGLGCGCSCSISRFVLSFALLSKFEAFDLVKSTIFPLSGRDSPFAIATTPNGSVHVSHALSTNVVAAGTTDFSGLQIHDLDLGFVRQAIGIFPEYLFTSFESGRRNSNSIMVYDVNSFKVVSEILRSP
ncbi:uncharacterized protein [Rutidosis leptorrhynchoides]|uniref:uncharacterized protein n=1 Tax=Rutidosis leptorrhynchoides TaxID=125765 RepID=UPI003A99F8BB